MRSERLAVVEVALIWPLLASRQSKLTISPEFMVITGGILRSIRLSLGGKKKKTRLTCYPKQGGFALVLQSGLMPWEFKFDTELMCVGIIANFWNASDAFDWLISYQW